MDFPVAVDELEPPPDPPRDRKACWLESHPTQSEHRDGEFWARLANRLVIPERWRGHRRFWGEAPRSRLPREERQDHRRRALPGCTPSQWTMSSGCSGSCSTRGSVTHCAVPRGDRVAGSGTGGVGAGTVVLLHGSRSCCRTRGAAARRAGLLEDWQRGDRRTGLPEASVCLFLVVVCLPEPSACLLFDDVRSPCSP
jgi:hypothetical protein